MDDFYKVHLNALPAWTVSEFSTNRYDVEYNYTDCYTGTNNTVLDSDYWHVAFETWYWQDNYDVVPGDQRGINSGSNPNKDANDLDSSNLTIWEHDTNPGHLMATNGNGYRVFLWVEPERQTRPAKLGNHNKTWGPGDNFPHGKIWPFLDDDYLYTAGPPGLSTTNNSSYTCAHTFKDIQVPTEALLMTSICWHAAGRSTGSYHSSHPFMEWPANDVLWYCAAGASPSYSTDNQLVTIFDGTNYYLKMGDTTTLSTMLLPLGPNDPGSY